jgi:hypothetical protein
MVTSRMDRSSGMDNLPTIPWSRASLQHTVDRHIWNARCMAKTTTSSGVVIYVLKGVVNNCTVVRSKQQNKQELHCRTVLVSQ